MRLIKDCVIFISSMCFQRSLMDKVEALLTMIQGYMDVNAMLERAPKEGTRSRELDELILV